MAEIFDNMLYPVQIALSGRTFFALWYRSDTDGFLLRTPGKLRTFPERHTAEVFCREQGYTPSSEESLFSDTVLAELQSGVVDCQAVLNWWNLLSDLAHTVGQPFPGDCTHGPTQDLYNKLFYGCNLPALRQDGPLFTPTGNAEERKTMQQVLEAGFSLLRNALD